MSRLALLALLAPLTCAAGCVGGVRDTTTARASEEMLLVSTSAQRAIESYQAPHVKGRKLWIDESYFVSIDKGYVISCLREQVALQGALLVDAEEDAELVLEIRNGTLGINDPEWTIGIPSIPLSFQGTAVILPRLAIGYDPQDAWAKFHYWTYDATSGETVDLSLTWGQAETGWFQSITPNVIGTVKAATGS